MNREYYGLQQCLASGIFNLGPADIQVMFKLWRGNSMSIYFQNKIQNVKLPVGHFDNLLQDLLYYHYYYY